MLRAGRFPPHMMAVEPDGRSAAVCCRGLAGRSVSVGARSGALPRGCPRLWPVRLSHGVRPRHRFLKANDPVGSGSCLRRRLRRGGAHAVVPRPAHRLREVNGLGSRVGVQPWQVQGPTGPVPLRSTAVADVALLRPRGRPVPVTTTRQPNPAGARESLRSEVLRGGSWQGLSGPRLRAYVRCHGRQATGACGHQRVPDHP
jgi:hypothetical protein